MANYPEYEYDGSDSELYQTNLYGGTDADLDTTERFTSDIDLTQKTYAVVDFKFDAGGTTDDLELYLYRRRDSSWDGDEIAIWSTTIASDGSEDIYSYTIGPQHGPGHYRFGMKSSGSTDTFDIDVQMRRARFEVATS